MAVAVSCSCSAICGRWARRDRVATASDEEQDGLSAAPLPLEAATRLTKVLVPRQNVSASRYLTIGEASSESAFGVAHR